LKINEGLFLLAERYNILSPLNGVAENSRTQQYWCIQYIIDIAVASETL